MTEKHILYGDETYNLAPFKYPWAFDMAQKSLANHWTPNEVQMGGDKSCYEQVLTNDERHMFKHVFASLTTADLAIQDNLTGRIYPAVKAAELRLYLSRQIAEEGLHSVTYQHVIEVLGLDQEETYSIYRKVPYIKAWFDYAREAVSSDHLMTPLIFYYAIFEGVFFPCAFAAVYSLHRRNLMTGTGQQIQYIHRDETAHVGFGMKLIKGIFTEANERPTQEAVHNLFKTSMQLLDDWAEYCIPATVGYNSDLHKQHMRYMADVRLRTLGYGKLYSVAEALPWLDAMASIKKEKNFFETRVTEYQSGVSLDFGDTGSMEGIMEWK